MAGMRWQDLVTSEEEGDRYGVKELKAELGQGRLCWFGHARRSGKDNTTKVVENMEVSRPVERPEKT
ncbi:hypothetical protein E2C01_024343 [Portunus trituberculatus]|uniref:Uncharacterized protein n=1 Tax=Portunus trituberculatus TaxID=210409 RepID=A0A5B7ECJ4_PORTR|nr:hypothetical protein [Portunus trituberculatus]